MSIFNESKCEDRVKHGYELKKTLRATTYLLITFFLFFASIQSAFSQTNFWEPTSGVDGEIWSIAIANNGDIWAAGDPCMAYLSTNNGNTWSSFKYSSYNYMSYSIAVNPVNAYVFVSHVGALYRSTNNGVSWERVSTNTAYSILFTQSGGIYYGTSDNRVFYSTDMGNTWQNKSNGLPNDGSSISGLIQGSDGTLYSTTSSRGVYRSTNGGDTWLPPSNYTTAEIGSFGNKLIIANDGSIFVVTYSDGVLKSTDKGITWNHVNSPLDNFTSNFSIIVYNPKTGHIFVAYNALTRFYRSTDLGANWYEVNNGLPNNGYVETLAVNPTTGMLFVGYSNIRPSIYRSTENINAPISVEKIEEIHITYSLMQNYPNPFNPTTKIQYSLPEASHVKLSVYNSIGQQVMQLVNENQSAGKYNVDLNAQNLQNGVYFYRLQTGKFVDTKKMLLIK